MPLQRLRRVAITTVAAAAAVVMTVLPSAHAAHAATAQPVGTVLVPGSAWAGSDASLGDLNVYSDGSTFNGPYQCTELAMRWAAVRFSESGQWQAHSAAGMWTAGPLMPVPFMQLPNGGAVPPQYGDILVFDVTSTFTSGHVAIVSGVGPGRVNIVEENGSWTGRATLPINGTTMPPRQGSNQPVIGWLRATGAPYTPSSGVPGGQILDSWGGLHAFGSAAPVSGYAYWPNWNIARDVATRPGDPTSGYTLDGWGGIHRFGAAPDVRMSAYWPGWDIARKLVLRADGVSGYVLDGFGGLHPFGVSGDMPPDVQVTGYWTGWDIARSVALRSDGVSGYVLDGFGGLHRFGTTPSDTPPDASSAYWNGWDIARGLVLSSNSGGYVLDGFGGVHSFGTATPVQVSGYYVADNARGIVLTSPAGGYVLFRTGSVRPFGDAPTVNMQLMGLPLGRAVG